MILRQANKEDIPALVLMGRMMHEESSYRDLDFDGLVFSLTLENAIDNQFCVVVEEDNTIIGLMIGFIGQTFFGQDCVASDQIVFVDKAYRGSSAASMMITGFIEWGKANAKQVRCGVSTGHPSRIYEKLGFIPCGGNFLYQGV